MRQLNTYINKDVIKRMRHNKINKYDLTRHDLIKELRDYPLGIVHRMMEEQEIQGNKADVTIFQNKYDADKEEGGFTWEFTEAGDDFWADVLVYDRLSIFFDRYPEYRDMK